MFPLRKWDGNWNPNKGWWKKPQYAVVLRTSLGSCFARISHACFTHRRVPAQKLVTMELVRAKTLPHRSPHREGFTNTRARTQKLLHTEASTHRIFVLRELFTQRRLCTEKPCHRPAFLTSRNRNFTRVLAVWLSFRAKGLHLRFQSCNFTAFFQHFRLTLYYNPVDPKQLFQSIAASACMLLVILGPDAGSFWRMSLEKSVAHKQVCSCCTVSFFCQAICIWDSQRGTR